MSVSRACLGVGRFLAHGGRIGRLRQGIEEFRGIHQPGNPFTGFHRAASQPFACLAFSVARAVAGEFYVAKQREQKLQQQTYVQAVHETGARMTHDVKNLLQSLNVLCAAAERDTAPDAGGELSSLMRRQLPAITQRLQQTLDKLQKPDASNGVSSRPIRGWEGLQRSYAGRGVEFSREGPGDAVMLPKELFRLRRRQPAAECIAQAQAR